MKKNIGKIILIVLGAALIALSAKGLMGVPGQKAALEAAVYLEEAVVLPENEGKLVIIHGEPEMLAPAYDEELKLTINTIKAYRYKETYKQTSFTDEERKWEWVSGGQETLTGQAKIGESVSVAAEQNGWMLVKYNKKLGWVSSAYLSTTKPVIQTIATSGNLQ